MAHHRVPPRTRVRLDRIDPADTGKHADEGAARAKLGRDIARLAKLQDVLYAERRHAVLVVRQRYDQINGFERILAENGTLILKFFLHISKGEQRRRLLERLADPGKYWKFSAGDLKERALWDRYVTAYEKLLTRCSTRPAPWYVIPADHRWYRNLAVASALVAALEGFDSHYPPPALSPAQTRRLRAALGGR